MENFVRQACREACAVLGLLPVPNLGCRASAGAAGQNTDQTGPMPSFRKFSLKLSGSRKLWHTRGWQERPPFSMETLSWYIYCRWSDLENSSAHAARRLSKWPVTLMKATVQDAHLRSCLQPSQAGSAVHNLPFVYPSLSSRPCQAAECLA